MRIWMLFCRCAGNARVAEQQHVAYSGCGVNSRIVFFSSFSICVGCALSIVTASKSNSNVRVFMIHLWQQKRTPRGKSESIQQQSSDILPPRERFKLEVCRTPTQCFTRRSRPPSNTHSLTSRNSTACPLLPLPGCRHFEPAWANRYGT